MALRHCVGGLGLLALIGCSPPQPPRPSLTELCKGDPLCMTIGAEAAREAEIQAYQPTYQPQQRVFIYGWPRVGGAVNANPIGYYDVR